jgi:hypothetical protein
VALLRNLFWDVMHCHIREKQNLNSGRVHDNENVDCGLSFSVTL